MWRRIKDWFWFFETLLFSEIVSSSEETILLKIMDKVSFGKHFSWWCGYCIISPTTNLNKVFREKYYTRYDLRYKQSFEFGSWFKYYLVFLWQFICGKPWISWKGAYYTCPFIVESLYFENKPESIYYIYPYGRWKKFSIKDRQRAWKEGKRYWKTWIRQNYEQGNMGKDNK